MNNNSINFTDPTGLICWYSQSTGVFECYNDNTGDVTVSTSGYAGAGAGRNDPNSQNLQNVGPIPIGTYRVGTPGTRLGTDTRHLTPVGDTETLFPPNRNPYDFFIHGANPDRPDDSSRGCIILPRGTRGEGNIPTNEILVVY